MRGYVRESLREHARRARMGRGSRGHTTLDGPERSSVNGGRHLDRSLGTYRHRNLVSGTEVSSIFCHEACFNCPRTHASESECALREESAS